MRRMGVAFKLLTIAALAMRIKSSRLVHRAELPLIHVALGENLFVSLARVGIG